VIFSAFLEGNSGLFIRVLSGTRTRYSPEIVKSTLLLILLMAMPFVSRVLCNGIIKTAKALWECVYIGLSIGPSYPFLHD